MTSNLPGDPSFDPPQIPQPPAPPPPPTSHAYNLSRSGVSFDPKTVHPMDWGILACGFLALIFSFFGYYTLGPYGESAWHGFFGWFAALVALFAAAALAVAIFAPQVRLPFPPRLIALGGFALALLCVILAGLVDPDGASGLSRGAGFYLSLIVILAGGALSYLRLKATGGKLPWEK